MTELSPARQRLADEIDRVIDFGTPTTGEWIVRALTGDHGGRVALALVVGEMRAEHLQAKAVETGRRVATWFEQVGASLAGQVREANDRAAARVEQNKTARRGGKETPGA